MSQKFKPTYSIYDAAEAIELVIGFGLSSDEVGLFLGCSSRAVDFWVRNYYTSTLNDKKRFETITKQSKV
ncbi:hypothetical protein HCX49_21890 [Sphingobacterium kitahiroshimense]|uniref:hypothetical protein n=1 Tax=Sphingobacterium sp. B16(2022) TaxID=2914044 RepID=UPI00143CA89B|nr:hypothetical protein [Sphingobacterium sp. B16(2022)]NJI75853.1 hypothetical protein [Sphingobacterium sp. B16(2022)]